MKKLSVLPLIIFGMSANATDYYLSSIGNDANSGITTASPWKTLDKLNSVSFKPGDNVYFNRGDVFYGYLSIKQSGLPGAPIKFGAYGSGSKPEITGFTKVASWKYLSSNIWESTNGVTDLKEVSMVAINKTNVAKGRFPNSNYLKIESHNGNTDLYSASLSNYDWTGAEVVMKQERWYLSRNTITAQSGNKITYAPYNSAQPHDGWGFFIQNDPRTLDTTGEWYFNPDTKTIQVYSQSEPLDVKVASVEFLVSIKGKEYIEFNNIAFTGANTDAINLSGTNVITINNCDFSFLGMTAVNGDMASNTTVKGCVMKYINRLAIFLWSYGSTNCLIENNEISDIFMFPGMCFNSGGGTENAISTYGDNVLIQANYIHDVGHGGISFAGGNTVVKNNFIRNFCLTVDDNAGIYTAGNYVKYGKVIDGNIILDAVGNGEGTGSSQSPFAQGIYIDDNGEQVRITGNTIAGGKNAGIKIHNARDLIVRGNTVYDNGSGWNNSGSEGAIEFMYNDATKYSIRGNLINDNILFAKKPEQLCLSLMSILDNNDAMQFATYDSNYFARPIKNDESYIRVETKNSAAWPGSLFSLSSWKSFSDGDAHSYATPKTVSDVKDIRFEYNATASDKTVELDARYIDVKGQVYCGSVTLRPYSSIVLIKDGECAANQSPTASAGANKTITLPTNSVSLSGSGKDADGVISSYKWTKISGPVNYEIKDPASPTTIVSGLAEGVYVFELKVTDNSGATGTSTVTITVKPAPNIAPVANAGTNKTITLPANIISLAGSGNDPDGTINSYMWTKTSGPSTYKIVNAASPVTDVTGLVEGVYVFELRVTDNGGATGTSTVTITVKPAPNIAPVANAGTNKTITLPTNIISLAGSGSDPDGTINGYMWTKTSGPSTYKIVNAASPVTDVTGLVEGVYVFELRVTDNKGAVGVSTVKVTVNRIPNVGPVADAGRDTTILAPVNFVSLAGSGFDKDGKIVEYSWTQILGPTESVIKPGDEPSANVTNLSEGTYEYELMVKDNDGLEGRDTVKITIVAGRIANIASEDNNVSVYPNPVKDVAVLEIKTVNNSANIAVVIMDISGRFVYRDQFVASQSEISKRINTSYLSKGTYVITTYIDWVQKSTTQILKVN